MSASQRTLLLAAGVGALTGIRSMSAVAVISLKLRARKPVAAGPARWLASQATSGGLALAAAGELVGDKLPFVSARTEPAPLLGRAAIAAVGAAAVAQVRGTSPVAAAAVGLAAAIVSATAVTNARRLVSTRLHVPSFLVGLAEDFVVARGASTLFNELS